MAHKPYTQQALTMLTDKPMDLHFIRILCLAVLMITGLSGCSKIQVMLSFPDEPQQKLREGEIAFEQGEFQKATDIFKEVYNSGTTEQVRNTAIYNLACTQLITATTTTEYLAAITILADWQRLSSTGPYNEDPHMIIEALKKGSLTLQHNILIIENQRDDALAQVDSQKAVLNTQDDKIRLLNHKMKEYQHQINELETIDQQLQEKKKPL